MIGGGKDELQEESKNEERRPSFLLPHISLTHHDRVKEGTVCEIGSGDKLVFFSDPVPSRPCVV